MPDEPPNLAAVPGGGQVASMDTSFEVALDDEPDGVAVPVHDGPGLPMPARPADRLPVIPPGLATRDARRALIRHHYHRARHSAAFHAIRSPRYAALTVGYSAVGAWRIAARLAKWAWHAEGAVLRAKAAAAGEGDQWLRVSRHLAATRRSRGTALAVAVAAMAGGGAALAILAPWWIQALAATAVVPPLARAGRPPGKPIITPATTKPRFRLLNADIVLRAYYAAKLGDPKKPGEQVTFAAPGMARDGEGSRVLVDLPYGKGLDDAVAARGKIASGLDVALSQVFIFRDPSSHRRHVLWVADRDPLAVPVGRTPLLACKPTDIWKPAPLGLDERGQLVELLLMWQSVLVGALPRQGKTFAARLLGLYAALDPYVKLHVFDPSGKPDWRKFALVAESCSFGLTPTREGLPPEILLDTLEYIKRDVQDRYSRLSAMPTSVCPEGKLTRDIARDPSFGMPVRVLLLDEFQEYFDLGSISKEIAGLLVFLTKVAPGAGVIVIDATQKPSGIGKGDVATAFTSARDNHAVRFSLRTSSYSVSEAVLGQGAYGEGLDSSTLLPEYKGVGILRGASDRSPTVRTYLADSGDAERILTAARGLRERAGTLSGMAAGEAAGAAARDVLGDVLAVFEGDAGLHWAEAAERLARRFPDRWEDVSGDALSAQCRALGVPSAQVKRSGVNLKGCRREDVEGARA